MCCSIASVCSLSQFAFMAYGSDLKRVHTVMLDASCCQAAASAVQLVKALLCLCTLLGRSQFLVLIDVVRLMPRGFLVECRLGLYVKLCSRSG